MKKIGVIGAGWLGLDVAKRWSEANEVRITDRQSTSPFFKQHVKFEVGEELPNEFVSELDLILISLTLPKNDLEKIDHFMNQLKEKVHCPIIFTSTIGVYTANEGLVDETSTSLNESSNYKIVEDFLNHSFHNSSFILRLGGLLGEDRHPIFSMQGKINVPNGQQVINLVHKEDIISFLNLILLDKVTDGTYNLVHPYHPEKESYYTEKALLNNLEIPSFLRDTTSGKIVSSEKSTGVEGFAYEHRP